MKARVALVILIVTALALGVGLTLVSHRASKDKAVDMDIIMVLKSNLDQTQKALDQERSDKMAMETILTDTRNDLSNKLTATEGTLATTAAAVIRAQAEAKAASEAAAAEITVRDKKISDLETQNQTMDKTANDLRSNIIELEGKINSTEKKLASSEGDREFLLKELKRLQSEKADIERKFNDLAELRNQVRKLKDELALSRRLDWLRRGLYSTVGAKGGERLIKTEIVPETNNVLNVELRQDGGVKIQSSQTTNAPTK